MLSATLPAGAYIIGDPCYFIDQWDELCDFTDGFSEQGFYEFNGIKMVVFNTSYGDGVYLSSDGFEYSVDAGLIGAVEATPKVFRAWINQRNLGTFEISDIPLECSSDSGILKFGELVIDTTTDGGWSYDVHELG